MTFDEWMTFGLTQGWIDALCATHDSLLTEEEWEMVEEDDPCIPVLRLREMP